MPKLRPPEPKVATDISSLFPFHIFPPKSQLPIFPFSFFDSILYTHFSLNHDDDFWLVGVWIVFAKPSKCCWFLVGINFIGNEWLNVKKIEVIGSLLIQLTMLDWGFCGYQRQQRSFDDRQLLVFRGGRKMRQGTCFFRKRRLCKLWKSLRVGLSYWISLLRSLMR